MLVTCVHELVALVSLFINATMKINDDKTGETVSSEMLMPSSSEAVRYELLLRICSLHVDTWLRQRSLSNTENEQQHKHNY